MREPSQHAVTAAESVFRAGGGILRTSEALAAGVHRRTLYWMRDQGMLEELSRGVYVLASAPLPSNPDVAAVMKRVPQAVLCLVSALDCHEIGTQIPHAVQIALPRSVRPPKIAHPRTEVFSMSERAFTAGMEQHAMGGVQIRVFGIAKTVADCFKYRHRIGLEVAIEALQEVLRGRMAAPAEIMRFARVDGVETVVTPYVQALL